LIVYFDTSALVPLLIDEATTEAAREAWTAADRVVATPLVYVEAHAGLAQARRLGRIDRAQLRTGLAALESIDERLDHVGITTDVLRLAGSLTEVHALRAYDAVHLASALTLDDSEVIFATGDRRLASAAREAGLVVNDFDPH
jgi:uncharacterized protein